MNWRRRDFIRLSAQSAGTLSLLPAESVLGGSSVESGSSQQSTVRPSRTFNGTYQGEYLNQIAFPMGGMGAGMFCLEGAGALSKFSFRHSPDLATDRRVFAAVVIKGQKEQARILEGLVPRWKLRPQFPGIEGDSFPNVVWGLPRFHHATFKARFPFATVDLRDDKMPLDVTLTGWSPFAPGDVDNASLPVAAVEYRISNRSSSPIDAVFSFHAENLLAQARDFFDSDADANHRPDRIQATSGGFILYGAGAKDRPWDEGQVAIWVDDPAVKVNHSWFRGQNGVNDAMQIAWKEIAAGACYDRAPITDDSAPGASLFLPFVLGAGEARTITVKFVWYVSKSNLSAPNFRIKDGKTSRTLPGPDTYQPWYAGRFAGIDDIKNYWQSQYTSLRAASLKFSNALFDSTLPEEAIEAVATNLSILKSPTVLRQKDGRIWAWEGTGDSAGAGGWGSCTHVWNYAQALPHLFPDMERGLRETEFGPNQGADGFQAHRASLPIHPIGDTEEGHILPAAADGQLGGIIKVYRDWRISGNTDWLRRLWPRIRASLDYCIRTWDPRRLGRIEEPHLNTYDISFWGPDGMAMSLYVGALKAAAQMGNALHESVSDYSTLLNKAVHEMEGPLFNGEYFIQTVMHVGLNAPFPGPDIFGGPGTPDDIALAEKEGPAYQVGSGCLSDGVLGAWLSMVCGLGHVLDRQKVVSHLVAVHRHNMSRDFTDQANALRPEYACGEEAGLLLCSWPKGGRPSLPVIYADEVWCGIEHQVASHLILMGKIDEGLDIVRSCRVRYDGRVRNPFSEIEAGHWYARSLSSYALLQALSGARYDAVEQVLHLQPAVKGDYRCFLSTATGYGTVGVKGGKPFLEVVAGTIPYKRIQYTPTA